VRQQKNCFERRNGKYCWSFELKACWACQDLTDQMSGQSIRKLWVVAAEARARPMDVELKARTPVRFLTIRERYASSDLEACPLDFTALQLHCRYFVRLLCMRLMKSESFWFNPVQMSSSACWPRAARSTPVGGCSTTPPTAMRCYPTEPPQALNLDPTLRKRYLVLSTWHGLRQFAPWKWMMNPHRSMP
jgi:hypothetical protein